MDHSGGWSLRDDLERRIDGCRELLLQSLDGLDDDQAKEIVVEGQPSLLGIVRHAAFVEGVWFDEAVTGRSRKTIGIPVATANSLKTRARDSVESVSDEYRRRIRSSQEVIGELDLEKVVDGRGERTVRELMVHVLGELSWRAGQADILRTLVLADPDARAS